MVGTLEAALRRHRVISAAALAGLAMMAWGWLLSGAGMGMDPRVSLAPVTLHEGAMAGMAMGSGMPVPPAWPVGNFLLIFSMWWAMMIAMMLPSAAPTILLYSRAVSHGGGTGRPATESFLAGYLEAWSAFSLLAAILHLLLGRSGLIAPMAMASQSRGLSAGILLLAGIYQISPLKDACLRQCRNPAAFLSRHYQPGMAGALRMGLLHGAYCVGCCWLLMVLLFIGGVMNLAWIALLSVLVAAEKLLPYGRAVAIGAGLACILWSGVILLG